MKFAAVLLLDWQQEHAGLVEVAVVGPAVEWGKPVVAGAGSATTVFDSVSASSVPCHADHEAAVVAVVGWPPLLRVGHHGIRDQP